MIMKLPKRNDAFIFTVENYGNLFTRLRSEVEINIMNRFVDDKFNIKSKQLVMDPQRIY